MPLYVVFVRYRFICVCVLFSVFFLYRCADTWAKWAFPRWSHNICSNTHSYVCAVLAIHLELICDALSREKKNILRDLQDKVMSKKIAPLAWIIYFDRFRPEPFLKCIIYCRPPNNRHRNTPSIIFVHTEQKPRYKPRSLIYCFSFGSMRSYQ